MKKLLISVICVICGFTTASAQKFALVDMEYILKNIPAYERANEQLNQTSKQWQAEVDALTTEAQTLYKNYQNEVVFLSKEQKKDKQDAIVAKEKEAADLRRSTSVPRENSSRSATPSCRPSKTKYSMPSRTSPTPEATSSSSTVPATQASSSAPRRSTSPRRS